MNNIYLFTAEWCSGCKQLKPELARIKSAEYTELDADEPKTQEFMTELGIRALPSLVKLRWDARKGKRVIAETLIGNRHSRDVFEKFFKED